MLFNSINFLYFALITIPLYWTLPRLAQNVFLIFASYYFYGSVHGMFLLLIIVSTLVDYSMALLIEKNHSLKLRRLFLLISIIVNLGILGYFKYFNFFAQSFADLFSMAGIKLSFTTLNVILPVGISFYTFQTMSYTIDVYFKKMKATKSFLDFSLYVAFFPQLVAGPIERASRLLPQLSEKRTFSQTQFFGGVNLILWGLLKKIVIADNLSVFVDVIFSLDTPSSPLIVVGLLGFAFQIYTDFSGYSDIARGLAKVLGIELMLNFNLPYFAKSPSEFWKRWHISLSEWIRDYIYIPLGGSKCAKSRQYFNLIVAMGLSGLWHGASLNFVIWGLYHAFIIIFYVMVVNRIAILKKFPDKVRNTILWGLNFTLVLYGWLLFRITDFSYLVLLNKNLFSLHMWGEGLVHALIVLSQMAVFIIPLLYFERKFFKAGDTEMVSTRHWGYQLAFNTCVIIFCVILGVEDNAAFIYFQF